MAINRETALRAARLTLTQMRSEADDALVKAQEKFDVAVKADFEEKKDAWRNFALDILAALENRCTVLVSDIPSELLMANYGDGVKLRIFTASRPTKNEPRNGGELERLVGFLEVSEGATVTAAELKSAGLEGTYGLIRWNLAK
jgi:hypothetical protein